MKMNAKNVILIMSGGSGTRFGADKPKQYCLMDGKPIIEYAIDACRHSSAVDQIVIVASQEYVVSLYEKYGFPVTLGGDNRTKSLANGLKYIADHYCCDKVIIANAVCPLMTNSQIDYYFSLLDDYDYILTAWRVVSTLGKYDGTLVDRNDYFQCMEPEAYRFSLLYENYRSDFDVPYIFHQLPDNARGFHCFDYPYTMKITYPRDVKIAELIYKDEILLPQNEKTKQKINSWLSSYVNDHSVLDWLVRIPSEMQIIADKWDIVNYSLNPQTFATCVYECKSKTYGDVIVKLHAPSGRYAVEKEYYLHSRDNQHLARLIDYDDDYRALLIEKIKPGIQVKYHNDDSRLDGLLEDFVKHMIPAEKISNVSDIPTIRSEYEQSKLLAAGHNFEQDFREKMQMDAERLWEKLFDGAQQYFLHRDLHRRNILASFEDIKAIDPLGVIGPMEFEFTISILIEAKAVMSNDAKIFYQMIDHYSNYCDRYRLLAASFITMVHKMNEYIFVKHDNYYLAGWVRDLIKKIFFEDGLAKKLSIELIGDHYV